MLPVSIIFIWILILYSNTNILSVIIALSKIVYYLIQTYNIDLKPPLSNIDTVVVLLMDIIIQIF